MDHFPARSDDALDATALLENIQKDVIFSNQSEETAYIWTRDRDRFSWESNASEVLGIRNLSTIENRHLFELQIAPEHVARRQQIFTTKHGEDLGNGVPYTIRYRFSPGNQRSAVAIWVEEHGRWWGDECGKPLRARGSIKLISDAGAFNQDGVVTSDFDELTGQLNRIRLTSALAAVIDRAQNSGMSSGFLVAAVSNLAVINETFGFDVGDDVLADVAQVLKGQLRGGDFDRTLFLQQIWHCIE